jgi:hypothetical protein
MIIKAILVLTILIVIGWFLSNRTTQQVRAWQKLGVILLTIIGIVVIVSPETSNDVAHSVGVGRGADLLLYLLTLAFIFMILNLYLKDKEEQRRITQLARKVAILEANEKYRKHKDR